MKLNNIKNFELLKKVEFISIAVLLTSFSLARFWTVYYAAPGYDFADTNSYFVFTLDDPIRMPLITFIFSRIEFYGAITIIQVILSSLAWVTLAISVYVYLPILKFLGLLLVLSLGLTTPVVELDTLLLSESLTISFLIFALSFMFLYLKFKKFYLAIIHLIFIVLYSQIKQSTLYLGLIWVLIFAILISIYELNKKEKFILLFFLTPLLSLFFLTHNLMGENSVHNRQLSTTLIIEKSFYSEKLRNYWFSQGFPPEAFLVYASPPFDIPIQMVRSLTTVKAWEKNTEPNPSYRLFREKPQFALAAPLLPELFIENYGYVNSILPAIGSGTNYVENQDFRDARFPDLNLNWIENWKLSKLFWWSEDFGPQKAILIFIFFNLFIFSILSIKVVGSKVLNSPYFLMFTLWLLMGAWANWLTAAYRYERYLAPTSIGLRVISIALLIMNIFILKKFISRKSIDLPVTA